MNLLYCGVSTLDQKTDKQRLNEKDFNIVVEDKCSGGVPFFAKDQDQKCLNRRKIDFIFFHQSVFKEGLQSCRDIKKE